MSDAQQWLETIFRAESGRLFGIAYRMLGSVSEAEEVVQDAFVRYQGVDPEEVREPGALLTTIATRLSIDRLKSARAERESYVGAWLPEPLLVDDEADVPAEAERADSISMAFLVLLESLSPLERAVFLLREAFDYDYAAIGEIVERTPKNCRQIALRARRQVEGRRPRFEASREEREEIVRRFFAAAEEGDSEGLLELLAADVVLYGDGGGKAPALGHPLYGAERVARALINWTRIGTRAGVHRDPVWVNGQPGVRVSNPAGELINVIAFDILGGEVQAVRSVVNPEKLGHLGPLADIPALLSRGGGDARQT
ncbi:MAG TPA: RNA polymerase sigma-70 factor [Solirubrobacterales bacterium]|jgi:RNA polymerase sigma-70 factor (ECF subfamily)